MKHAFPHTDGFAVRARHFFGSRVYVALVMLIIFAAHTLALEIPALYLLAVSAGVGTLVSYDLRFLLPPLLGGVCLISVAHTPYLPTESDYFSTGARPYLIGGAVVLLLCGLCVFMLRNRKRAAPLSSLRLRWGFLAFFAAMVFSGLLQENALKNLLYGVGVGASFLAIYLLFGVFHPKTKENAEHFLFTLTAIGFLVAAQLVVLYLAGVSYEDGVPLKETVLIGWGTWTHVGALAAMCLPAPFYFAREARRPLPYLLAGGVLTVALLASASRAAWLYGRSFSARRFCFFVLAAKTARRAA